MWAVCSVFNDQVESYTIKEWIWSCVDVLCVCGIFELEAFARLGSYTALAGIWLPTYRDGLSYTSGPLKMGYRGRPATSEPTTEQPCAIFQNSEGLNCTAV
jgi:hypothetical protein